MHLDTRVLEDAALAPLQVTVAALLSPLKLPGMEGGERGEGDVYVTLSKAQWRGNPTPPSLS